MFPLANMSCHYWSPCQFFSSISVRFVSCEKAPLAILLRKCLLIKGHRINCSCHLGEICNHCPKFFTHNFRPALNYLMRNLLKSFDKFVPHPDHTLLMNLILPLPYLALRRRGSWQRFRGEKPPTTDRIWELTIPMTHIMQMEVNW